MFGDIMKIEIKNCNNIISRFMGMMFLKNTSKGFFFKGVSSIHTCFCRFNIDVILLDKNNNIIDIKYNLKPWRFYFFKCYSILEFQNGFIKNIKKDEITHLLECL